MIVVFAHVCKRARTSDRNSITPAELLELELQLILVRTDLLVCKRLHNTIWLLIAGRVESFGLFYFKLFSKFAIKKLRLQSFSGESKTPALYNQRKSV